MRINEPTVGLRRRLITWLRDQAERYPKFSKQIIWVQNILRTPKERRELDNMVNGLCDSLYEQRSVMDKLFADYPDLAVLLDRVQNSLIVGEAISLMTFNGEKPEHAVKLLRFALANCSNRQISGLFTWFCMIQFRLADMGYYDMQRGDITLRTAGDPAAREAATQLICNSITSNMMFVHPLAGTIANEEVHGNEADYNQIYATVRPLVEEIVLDIEKDVENGTDQNQ